MSLYPYLNFNGNCRQAFDFYADIFGADKSDLSLYSDAPPSSDYTLPEESKGYVLHAELLLWGSKIMMSDAPPGSSVDVGSNVGLAFVVDDVDMIKHAFARLSEGGTVVMELQETFWTQCYGTVVDQFGVMWSFNHRLDK